MHVVVTTVVKMHDLVTTVVKMHVVVTTDSFRNDL